MGIDMKLCVNSDLTYYLSRASAQAYNIVYYASASSAQYLKITHSALENATPFS